MFNSVHFSRSVVSLCDPMNHSTPDLPCPSTTARAYQKSCPLSQWCHPTISSSVVPFCSCPQSLPASGSFQMSQLFASGGQNIGVSASISVHPRTTQNWNRLGWTGWISLQSKGLSRVFSNTTVQKHQFFGVQLSLYSNYLIHTDPMDYTVCGILQARILEWVAFLFSRISSQAKDRTQVSRITGRLFTSWATREAWLLALLVNYL